MIHRNTLQSVYQFYCILLSNTIRWAQDLLQVAQFFIVSIEYFELFAYNGEYI